MASQSPRRRELLTTAGFQFTVCAAPDEVEETADKDLPPEQLVLELARLKAEHVAGSWRKEARLFKKAGLLEANEAKQADASFAEQKATIIIAADTVAHCGSEILGKPTSRADAKRMLRLMSGQRHQVLTGVCLWHIPSGRHLEFLEITTLRMSELSETQLESFLDTGQWVGKAGGFGFQDGLDWVHIEIGLASNVVGLPVERLAGWIEETMIEKT